MSGPSSTPNPLSPALLLSEAVWMQALARALVFDPHRADDVVQEAWLAALEHPPADARNLRGWLAQVLRNAARQIDRGERRRHERERAAARGEASFTDEEVRERADLHRFLVDAVLSLGEPYRTTILLRYFEGLNAEEIAVRVGVTGTAVRTRLARGLDQLRARLDRQHGGDRRAWSLSLCPLPWRPLSEGTTTSAGWTAGHFAIAALLVLVGGAVVVATTSSWPGGDEVHGESLVAELRSPIAPEDGGRAEQPDDAGRGRTPVIPEAAPVAEGNIAPAANVAGEVPTRLTGRVTDFETGAPLAGAEVHVGPSLAEGDAPDAFTDEEGWFTVEHPGRGDVRLLAVAEGYGGVRRMLALDAARTSPIALPLVRGAAIEGVVTDRAGRPVADAEIFIRAAPFPAGFDPLASHVRDALLGFPDGCWLFEDRAPDRRRVSTERVARSDAQGRFRIDCRTANGGASCARVHVEHPDFASATGEPVILWMPSSLATTSIVLDLGASLRGRVRQDGQGVKASVWWWGPGDTFASADTDDEGAYSFTNVPPGEVRLTAKDPRFRRLFETRPLELAPGEERFEDFDLSYAAHTIAGRVVDADGEAVEGAALQVIGKGVGNWEVVTATSTEDGSYAVALPHVDGRTYDVELHRPPLRLTRSGLAAGAEGVDFRLPRLVPLVLEVVDGASGKPLRDYEVFWRVAGEANFLEYEGDGPSRGSLLLPAGAVDLRVCAHEQNYRAVTLEDVPVPAGGGSSPLRVELFRGTRLDVQWVGDVPGAPDHHIFFLLTDEQWPLVDGRRNRFLGYDFGVGGSDEAIRHEIRQGSMGLDHWGNVLDAEGRVALRGTTPGRYRIKSIPDDLVFEPSDIVVPDAESSTLIINWRQVVK